MARKKRRRRKKVERPFCWYCERKFVDERILVMHQKARHFKCPHCLKKLGSVSGLVVHIFQMHKEKITKVPNSKPNHDSIHYDIYGMDGVPYEDIVEYRNRNTNQKKKQSIATGNSSTSNNANPKASSNSNQRSNVQSYPQEVQQNSWHRSDNLTSQNYWSSPDMNYGQNPLLSSQPVNTATSKGVVLVFDNAELSQEELRAKLDRYSYNTEANIRRMEQLDEKFESRLAHLSH